jgi:hypothetical protein
MSVLYGQPDNLSIYGDQPMKTIKKLILAATVLSSMCAANAFGVDTERRRPMGGHGGPPPEAYTACEDKTEGDTAEFVSPHGDTVTGTCEQEGDQLVLRPDNPPDGRRRNDVND